MFGMGLQGGQGLAGLGSQFSQGFGQLGQQYGSMAPALQGLQQNDIQSMMGMGGLNRGRNQSLMDLNYQNFMGQYNLPMQTLQNVGSVWELLDPWQGATVMRGDIRLIQIITLTRWLILMLLP
jgi:hypothetical protein